MSETLELYLEEIGRFLYGREEREEILSEVKSHILEKTEHEYAHVTESSILKVIDEYGPARRVAERYMEGRQIIAPVFHRYFFRYTVLFFIFHVAITMIAIVFNRGILIFPFLYIPRMGFPEALFFLPNVFLVDLGAVSLILYLITHSKKEIKIPWPGFSINLDETSLPRARRVTGPVIRMLVMIVLTVFAAVVFIRNGTIFFAIIAESHKVDFQPFFTPEAGYRLSMILIAALGFGVISSFVHIFTSSRWVNVCSDVISMAFIGIFLSIPFDEIFISPAGINLRAIIKNSLLCILLIIGVMVTFDLLKSLVILGRRKLIDDY